MFGRRSGIILIFLFAWTACAMAMLCHISVQERDFYIDMGNKMAWKRGIFPAPRGRILDSEGRMLAWSERRFDLWLERGGKNPGLSGSLARSIGELVEVDPGDAEEETGGVLLKKNLSPEEIIALEPLMDRHSEIRLVSRLERKRVDCPEARDLVGDTDMRDGRIFGVSGMERDFDERLRGREGSYKVMLDRRGRWIKNTWELELEAVPGDDVAADISLEKVMAGRQRGAEVN